MQTYNLTINAENFSELVKILDEKRGSMIYLLDIDYKKPENEEEDTYDAHSVDLSDIEPDEEYQVHFEGGGNSLEIMTGIEIVENLIKSL